VVLRGGSRVLKGVGRCRDVGGWWVSVNEGLCVIFNGGVCFFRGYIE
jgi:hypothetical protein